MMDWKHALSVGFHSILLWLDAIIYQFVAVMYDIFVLLARTNIFKDDFYRNFSQRIYSVLGVIMLFVLAYALLKALVDPEQLTKGEKGISKMVPTFVTSLVICGLLPSIFDFAYNIQNFILEKNTIGILVLGTGVANSEQTNVQNEFGVRLAYTSLSAFLNAEKKECNFGEYTCDSIEKAIQESSSNFVLIGNMADAIVDGKVTYHFGFSTAVGIFLIYVLATFSLDLAVRAARLAFLQLIAPIPVLMRVMPTKNEVFKKWLKKTIACFTEVFVRVFIMYLVVYFISNFELNWASGAGLTGIIANVLIIMGILMFAKEFPKLLSDITGIDSGNIKLGLKDFMGKLGAGGALGAGAFLGASALGLTRGITHSIQGGLRSFRSVKDQDLTGAKKAAAIASGIWGVSGGFLSSGIKSAFSAGTRAGIKGMSAKNLADMNKARKSGVEEQEAKRNKLEAYRASHRMDIPFIGTAFGSGLGHIKDFGNTARSTVGWGESAITDNRLKEAMNAIKNSTSGIQNVWKDSDAWKKADERLTRARGNLFKYTNQAQWDAYNEKLAQARASFSGTDDEWNAMDHSDIARAAGISDATNFISALRGFNRADADIKGIERAIQSQPNKQSQLQGVLRTLGANMDKYADLKVEVLKGLNSSQTSLLDRIDLANVNISDLSSNDLDTLYGMLGSIKGNASNAISDVERRELFRTQANNSNNNNS